MRMCKAEELVTIVLNMFTWGRNGTIAYRSKFSGHSLFRLNIRTDMARSEAFPHERNPSPYDFLERNDTIAELRELGLKVDIYALLWYIHTFSVENMWMFVELKTRKKISVLAFRTSNSHMKVKTLQPLSYRHIEGTLRCKLTHPIISILWGHLRHYVEHAPQFAIWVSQLHS